MIAVNLNQPFHSIVGYASVVSTPGEIPGEPTTVSDAEDYRLRRIESMTDTALAHLDVEDLLVELLDRVRELIQVDTAAVLLLDSAAEQLVATAARGVEAGAHQAFRVPMGKGFAGRVAAGKEPVIIERVDHTNVINPILREHGSARYWECRSWSVRRCSVSCTSAR